MIDGRQTRVIRRSAHWAIARRIAAEMAERPAGGAGAAAWYRATCALMQEWAELDTLAVQLEAGLALFGRDPVLALQKGTLHQTFGDARLKDYVRQRRALASSRSAAIGGDIPRLNRGPARNMMPGPPAPPPGSSRVSPASRAELNAAEREFRRALSLNPLLHEARIRLAHVLSRLGDDRQAVAVVEPALQADLAPFSEFYAAESFSVAASNTSDDSPTPAPPTIGRRRAPRCAVGGDRPEPRGAGAGPGRRGVDDGRCRHRRGCSRTRRIRGRCISGCTIPTRTR